MNTADSTGGADKTADVAKIHGPYETESDAAADTAGITGELPPDKWTDALWRKLFDTLTDAYVDTGLYDAMIIRRISMWEPQAVQSVIGFIERARYAALKSADS
jgi:hypothetical protein